MLRVEGGRWSFSSLGIDSSCLVFPPAPSVKDTLPQSAVPTLPS